jgi:hypothetical protein
VVYPLIVFVVSGAFMAAVLRQYVQRRRPHQLVWTFSLASAAGGSLAYFLFLAAGKAELAFRLYYILGALLTAPLLGLGSLLLMARSDAAQARVRWVVCVVVAGCIIDAILLLTNPIDRTVLQKLNGGPGTDVYPSGPWEPLLIVLAIFGAAAVIGVAIYSGWQLYKRTGTGRLVAANVLIALGTITIAEAGGQARTGFGPGLFWLTMTVGWIVLFGGFLLTFNLQRVSPNPARDSALSGKAAGGRYAPR